MSNLLGIHQTEVEAVVEGRASPVRAITSESALLGLRREIGIVAMTHCGAAYDSVKKVCEDAARMMKNHFAGLGQNEVKMAFDLAAAGRLTRQNGKQVETIVLKTYGGVFTVELFGSVIAAYDEQCRKAIVAELANAHDSEESEAKEVQRLAVKAEAEARVVADFQAALQNNPFGGWLDVPHWWGGILLRRELVPAPTAEQTAMARAATEAKTGLGDDEMAEDFRQNRRRIVVFDALQSTSVTYEKETTAA